MAHGWRLEAEYESGYLHREDEQDASPFVRGKNILHDIREGYPTVAHGKLVRFSLIGPAKRYDLDWTKVPPGAIPFYERDLERDFHPETGWTSDARLAGHRFGYEHPDGNDIVEIAE